MEAPMADVAAVFAAQDGIARIAQLTRLGVSEGLIRQRVRTGEWQRLARGLVGVAAPDTWRRRARAAVLAAGVHAVLSHASAARLHGLDGFDRDERLVVTGMRGHQITSLAGVEVHRCGHLDAADRIEIDGLACVTRPVALIQLAAADGRDAMAKALDGMLRDGNSPEWIRQVASRWRRSGVAGPSVVLDVLHQHVDGRLPRSWFQRLAKRALVGRGIATVDEFPVRDLDGRLLADLDLAVPDLKIGVECQSWRWHGTPSARAADARRKRRLRLLGWELVEVWWTDLDRLDEVVDELRLLVDHRLTRFSSRLSSLTTETTTRPTTVRGRARR